MDFYTNNPANETQVAVRKPLIASVQPLPRINIWFVSGMSLCNFDCAYCASGVPEKSGARTRDREWFRENDHAIFQRVLFWISKQPARVGLRLQTIGEPFVSRKFLKGAAAITHAKNIEFVELVTKGSMLTKRLPRLIEQYKADINKLRIWITFHHTEISAEKLVEQALFSKSIGVTPILNALLFPDNIDAVLELSKLCKKHGLELNIDLGHNYNGAYQDHPFLTVQNEDLQNALNQLDYDKRIMLSAVSALKPFGLPCSAGHDYIYINFDGSVFPCKTYQRMGPQARLGSAADPHFRLRLRSETYKACQSTTSCKCKEDFLHLEIAKADSSEKESLGTGYYIAQPINIDRLIAVAEGKFGATRFLKSL